MSRRIDKSWLVFHQHRELWARPMRGPILAFWWHLWLWGRRRDPTRAKFVVSQTISKTQWRVDAGLQLFRHRLWVARSRVCGGTAIRRVAARRH